jgi:CRISPR system Cascade subunit CasE
MYLSRLILNPRSRQVRNELADPYEMHRTVSHAFPNGEFGKERGEENATNILFRVDLHPRTRIPTLLVQSRQKPDWSFLLNSGIGQLAVQNHGSKLPDSKVKNYLLGENELPLDVENPAVKELNLRLQDGQVLAFRLRANPTKRLKENAKRIGLLREEDQYAWIQKKFETAGAALINVNIVNEQFTCGKLFKEMEKTKRLNFLSVQFDGILQVKDKDALTSSIFTGFGSAKGLGFGLLSLARAQ